MDMDIDIEMDMDIYTDMDMDMDLDIRKKLSIGYLNKRLLDRHNFLLYWIKTANMDV
jgi:hypothetical protein